MNDLRELPRGAGQRVLEIEDAGALALVVAEMLEQLGYRPLLFNLSPAGRRPDRKSFDAVIRKNACPASPARR